MKVIEEKNYIKLNCKNSMMQSAMACFVTRLWYLQKRIIQNSLNSSFEYKNYKLWLAAIFNVSALTLDWSA